MTLLVSAALQSACLACTSDELVGASLQSPAADSAVRAMATWNVIALQTTSTGPFSPPRESRAVAMVSMAMFDAVNSITGQYEPFTVRVVAERTASPAAAIIAAAHDVLAALYPSAVSALDVAYDSSLAPITGQAKEDGISAGAAAAAAVLAMRQRDNSADHPRYSESHGPGAWIPTPPAFAAAMEPGWGKVVPFVLDSGSQFRPAAPPQPGSAAYVRDYAEIVPLGVAGSATRTAAQTEAARFWMATAPQLWNQVVRQLTVARKMDPASAARAYLLVNVASADAAIASWDAKFTYGQWRPVSAIRSTADDGSASTHPDTAWAPLLATPPFPDYPAGHTTIGGAAERVLTEMFGGKPGPISITSPTASGVTHHYASFAEISEEVVNARVWAGVHWRTSSTAGRELGQVIGKHVWAHAPRARLSP
jgi:hypothetical protein